MVRMGRTLESAPQTENAFAGGRIDTNQAAVIASAVAALPPETTSQQNQACEDTLIGDADRFTLKDLRRRAERITDQFKPRDEVDQIENAALEHREREAWRRSEFWMVDNRDGTHRGGFVMPDAQADMLRNAIEAISAPRRDHLHDHEATESYYDRDLDHRHRLGMGFAELCGHLPTDELPGKGGLGATLLRLARLRNPRRRCTPSHPFDRHPHLRQPGPTDGMSAWHHPASVCKASPSRSTMAPKSAPSPRPNDGRWKTATADAPSPHCDRPPGWCEAHHAKQPWAIGKTTNLDEGVLLCAHHHRTVHRDGWAIRFASIRRTS